MLPLGLPQDGSALPRSSGNFWSSACPTWELRPCACHCLVPWCLGIPGLDTVGLQRPLSEPAIKIQRFCGWTVGAMLISQLGWGLSCPLEMISPLNQLQVKLGLSHSLYRAWWKEGLPYGSAWRSLAPAKLGRQRQCWSAWHADICPLTQMTQHWFRFCSALAAV